MDKLANPSPLANELSSLLRAKKYLECINKCSLILGTDKNNLEGSVFMAEALEGLGNPKCLASYDNILNDENRFPLSKRDRGYLYAIKGMALIKFGKTGAEESFRKSLEFSPDELYALDGLGHCLNKRSKFTEALVYFEKALDRNPMFGRSLGGKEQALRSLGRKEEAKEVAQLREMLKEAREKEKSLMSTQQSSNTTNIVYVKQVPQLSMQNVTSVHIESVME